ncbi:alpha/beta hydrolase [Sporobolomyces koalae]|uniref:alpha/beta hydrolase n=1 Tax=Sporobolomyces koalae TaxID=500713 RepID=UPI0031736DCF
MLSKLHWLVPVVLGAFVLSLTCEPIQRSLIYLHWAKWPLPILAHFATPTFYGFAPGKVQHLYLDTNDGARLGAWLVLAEEAYDRAIRDDQLSLEGHLPSAVFESALRSPSYPTVLYFHGNAGSRAVGNRIRVAQKLSASNCNVLMIDYRGFADSSSSPPPTEQGMLIDATRAFDYLHLEHKVDPAQIVVMGQSLGTGIGTALVASLVDRGIHLRSLVLIAPFSSIAALLETYKLGQVIPLVSPLRRFPWLFNQLLSFLRSRFDTRSVISKVKCPILLVHAQDDPVIPFSHSRTLSEHLLEPLLHESEPERTENDHEPRGRQVVVEEQVVGGWGTVKRFERGQGFGRVVWAEAKTGGHTFIGETEYVMRLVDETIRG